MSVVFSSLHEADTEAAVQCLSTLVPALSGACPLSAFSKGAKSSPKLSSPLPPSLSYTDGEVLGSAKGKGSLQTRRLGSRDLENSALGINGYDCD